ncbi:NfrA family protein [Aquibaculum sediminis]|uniref:NfrA family protein n=1 Tax=Aquibaculum sediminis TaxID=3231907 RepID=UPI003454FC71
MILGPRCGLRHVLPCLLVAQMLLAPEARNSEAEGPILLHLTAQGVVVRSLNAEEAGTYEDQLRRASAVGWLAGLRQRVRRHPVLRDFELALKRDDLDAARRIFATHVQRHAGDLLIGWRLLEAHAAQGDDQSVILAADRLLRRLPSFGPAYLRRAEARYRLGEQLQAYTDFTRALEQPLAPAEFARAATAQLQILVDLGEPEAARRLGNKLHDVLPPSRGRERALGHAAHALDHHETAVAHFRKAIELGAGSRVTLALANSLDLAGHSEEALQLILGRALPDAYEPQRRRLLSRLAERVGVQGLAMTSAAEALALGEDPLLRLELAQRLLDRNEDQAGNGERAWLVLAGAGAQPCHKQPEAAQQRCLRLAVAALRRSGRSDQLGEMLRSAFAASQGAELLAALVLAVMEEDRPLDAARLLTGLSAAADSPHKAADERRRAAEVYLAAGRGDVGLHLLLSGAEDAEGQLSPRAARVAIYAAQQAGAWQHLVTLLHGQPRAADGLPQDTDQARSYCDALGRLGSTEEEGCLLALARRLPQEAELLYRAASLARARGDDEAAARRLAQAVERRAVADWLLELGHLELALGREARAERRFRAAVDAGAGPQARLALAYALLQRGRRGMAAHLLRQALEGDLPQQQRLTALEALADILVQSGALREALAALTEAADIEASPGRLLRLAAAQLKLQQFQRARASLLFVDPDDLEPQHRARYFDLLAEAASGTHALELQVRARRAALTLAPTGARHELLADALLATDTAAGREEARHHLAQAIALDGTERPALLARLAHLDRAAGESERAEALMRLAANHAPDVPEYREDLAQLLADSDQPHEAVPHLRAALEAASAHPHATMPHRRRKVAELQARHAALTRRWRLRWEESFCLGGSSDCERASLVSTASQLGQGLVEVGYQPIINPQLGRFELTARVNWDRDSGSLAPRPRYAQAAFGLRARPSASRDFWVGFERLQALGPEGRDDWRVFGTYRWARGLDWRIADKGHRLFSSVYGEMDRYVGGAQETNAFADARIGLRGQWGEDFAYMPFAYVAGSREESRETALYRVEAGLGLAGSWRIVPDLYDGYLGEATVTLRLGRETDSLGKSATRGTLGLGVRY